ncbi:hypothetical protein [Flavobacterium collinsii]|uniref:Uncharacterized protein n=1 Tax=Flavobacterium collinsii TaxID=1114861 RepID=A0ABM8KDU5_9FLAO|nr:hypothetical protein [Flavobacterium collinsii]CAA9195066.1 hypothetical protein FLACOL7796_00422 [Flavobacterium collinsii]
MDTIEKTEKVFAVAVKITSEENATTIARLKKNNLYQVLNSLNDEALIKLANAIQKLQDGRVENEKKSLIQKLKAIGVSEEEIKKLYK